MGVPPVASAVVASTPSSPHFFGPSSVGGAPTGQLGLVGDRPSARPVLQGFYGVCPPDLWIVSRLGTAKLRQRACPVAGWQSLLSDSNGRDATTVATSHRASACLRQLGFASAYQEIRIIRKSSFVQVASFAVVRDETPVFIGRSSPATRPNSLTSAAKIS